MKEQLRKQLQSLVALPVALEEPLRRYTTFAIGGPAQALVRVQSLLELQNVLAYCAEHAVFWRVLGKGSNVVISDAGFEGIIILLDGELKKIHAIERQRCNLFHVYVGAGCSFSRLLLFCQKEELTGLEFAAGLPGSLGGAVVMNAGAWGQSIGDSLHSVEVLTQSGLALYGREELVFSYRKTKGLPEDGVVVGATLSLTQGDGRTIVDKCCSLLQKRKDGQPLNMPNAGSIFKNPPGESAGRLIESSGLKGVRVGDAQVSEIHANFIVNCGQARAVDVLALIEHIQKTVALKRGIMLEPEVHLLCSK